MNHRLRPDYLDPFIKVARLICPASVTDPRLRVHGVDGLMITNSVIFPGTIMHNSNLACYAAGEIATDTARGKR